MVSPGPNAATEYFFAGAVFLLLKNLFQNKKNSGGGHVSIIFHHIVTGL